jgi:hypothetical protein
MSLQYSPKITTDGLVMCLDASNNKSYPTDLPVKGGLLLWLDAADDSTFSYSSGNIVSQWRDKSGLNNHSSQATVGNQPSRSTFQNSRKTITFDGTNDFLDGTSALTLANGYTAFTIVKSSATGERDIITSTPAAQSTDIYLYQQASSGKFGNWSNVYTSNPISLNVWYLFSTNVSSVGSETLYLNGSSQASNSRSLTNTRGYRVGAYYTGSSSGEYWSGEIAEILIFNRALSSTEMKQVHTYLGQKWGISNTDRSIVDLSNNNNNGLFGNATVANMPDYDFYNKGALTFNGTSDYVNLGNASSIRMGTSNFTISTWVKILTQTGTPTFKLIITSKNAAAAAAGYGFAWNNSVNKFLWSTANGSSSSEIFTTNTWSSLEGVWANIVMVRQNGATNNGHFYINGVYESLASAATVLNVDTATNMTIANSADLNSSYWFKGLYGPVHIYNKALSAAEVLQNYEAQKSKFANTIVQQGLLLNLDAGNPYSYAGAGAAWYDVSGNGYVSSLTNTQTYNSDNGGSINFNGSTESVSAGPNSNLFLADMTAEVWIKITAMSGDWVRIIGTGSDPRTFGLWYYVDGRILWQRTGSSAVNPEIFPATPVLTVGSWAHVAATTIGMSHVLYLNGVSIGTNPSAGGPWGNSNTAITIGYAGYHAYSNSNIASARLYTRGLSAAEILQNYNATKGRFGL